MKTVIFDMDGTLADVRHRLRFLSGPEKDFNAFHGAMGDDTPNALICDLAAMYASDNNYYLIICTGRPERYRTVTKSWLSDYAIEYHGLFMRPNDRLKDKDCDVKRDMLNLIRKLWPSPIVAVEDRSQVVKMYREEGLVCLQVAEGNF